MRIKVQFNTKDMVRGQGCPPYPPHTHNVRGAAEKNFLQGPLLVETVLKYFCFFGEEMDPTLDFSLEDKKRQVWK